MILRDIKTELAKQLIRIEDEDDYILGILARLKTPQQVKKMLDYIEAGHRDVEDLIVASIYISRGIE